MRRTLSIIALALIALTSMGPVRAQDDDHSHGGVYTFQYDRDDDDDDNSWRRRPGAVKFASSYINPDTGLATANPDVRQGSNCYQPDRNDKQALSSAGTGDRNVHNDACLFDRRGNFVDAPVSWESTGVGVIFRCPDPDGAGPKVAVLTGNRCYQSGFQSTGMAGDGEYHVRLNNTDTPGKQDVAFCYDPENNGCSDARVISYIRIRWTS